MFKKYLIVFLISMLPIIELRGAIPIALAKYNLNPIISYIVSIIGNIIPVPFIYFFIKGIIKFLKNTKLKRFANWIEKKGNSAGEKLKKNKNGVYVGLFLFVAIPLPGTGAWTGTLASSILNLDFKKSFIAISFGVLTAGIIMYVLSVLGIHILK